MAGRGFVELNKLTDMVIAKGFISLDKDDALEEVNKLYNLIPLYLKNIIK